jgi:hypothetical protein
VRRLAGVKHALFSNPAKKVELASADLPQSFSLNSKSGYYLWMKGADAIRRYLERRLTISLSDGDSWTQKTNWWARGN